MGKNCPQSLIFSRFEIFERPLFGSKYATSHFIETRTAHAHKHVRASISVKKKIIMAEDIYNIRTSSCFMHFDGVTEQLCEFRRKRLKKFLECRLATK